MPIELVLAVVCFTAGGSIFVGFAAGRARRREDRLRLQARAWRWGYLSGAYDQSEGKHEPRTDPYTTELKESRNA
ncbi:hypothetical protein SEA_MILANI_36 [Microbacterium phage Milani]|nr:hypothetical protein SEA_MILANI_36 [Microbacterium phage Milani]